MQKFYTKYVQNGSKNTFKKQIITEFIPGMQPDGLI